MKLNEFNLPCSSTAKVLSIMLQIQPDPSRNNTIEAYKSMFLLMPPLNTVHCQGEGLWYILLFSYFLFLSGNCL